MPGEIACVILFIVYIPSTSYIKDGDDHSTESYVYNRGRSMRDTCLCSTLVRMNKPVIAVDVDDVMVPHFGELARFASGEFGIQLTARDMFYDGSVDAIMARTGRDREEIMSRVDSFLMADEFYIDPVPGAKEVLPKLAENHELVIVTSRPQPMKEPTLFWLEKHFPAIFSQVRVVGHERWGIGVAPKAGIFRELGVSILIDDHPQHCKAAAEQGIRALLFGEYPWSDTTGLPEEIEQVRDWTEVAAKLLT